jgi:hypothetical protein
MKKLLLMVPFLLVTGFISVHSQSSPVASDMECLGAVVADLTELGGDGLFILQIEKGKQVVVVYTDATVKDNTNGKAYTKNGLLQVGTKIKLRYTVENTPYLVEEFKDRFKPSSIYTATYVELN